MDMCELKKFYESNYKNFVKRIYRSCGNFHDAEDIVQESFERAIKYMDSCRKPDKWFSGILRNSYRDYISRKMAWPVTRPIDDHMDDLDPLVFDDSCPLTASQVERLISREIEPDKQVLRLNVSWGFSQGEIHQIVPGLTISKIHNIISKFKAKLIKRMK